jgi:hypothetical protein
MEVAESMIETEAVSPAENDLSPEQQQVRRKKGSSTSARSCSSSQNGAEGEDLVTKALVADYVSDVSSEDFSGPEDGECESDGGTGSGRIRAAASPSESKSARRVVHVPSEPVVKAPIVPNLIENASPIEEDDDDLGLSKKYILKASTFDNKTG